MDNTFMTLAQISATFLALVFAGFSIFIENLRNAVDSVRKLSPYAEETASSVIYVIGGYSLYIYGVALLISLAGLAADQHFAVVANGSLALIAIMWLLIELSLRRREVVRQTKKLKRGGSFIWLWLQIRIWLTRLIFLITVLSLSEVTLCSEKTLFFSLLGEEPLIYEVITYVMIGIIFNVIDLVIFRVMNVPFSWNSVENAFREIDKDVTLKMSKAKEKYNEWASKREDLSPPALWYFNFIDEQYRLLQNSYFMKFFLSLEYTKEKEIASMEEIIGYYLGYQMLLSGINNLLAKLQGVQEEIKIYAEKSNNTKR